MNTQSFYLALTSCAVTLALSACGASNKAAPQIAEPTPLVIDFQALLDSSVKGEIPGVVLYVDSPSRHFYGAAGIADLDEQTPMQIDARIPNGSAGKKLTALLAAMLVDEQLLDLDAPISHYLPENVTTQIEFADDMTARHLLQHSAGLFDYLNDSDGAFYNAVLNDPFSLKTDSYAMQFVYGQGAHFAPGEGWRYSNSGYLVTGLILDNILGEHHSRAMRRQVFEPFGLSSMSYGGIEKDFAAINSGYFLNVNERINTKPYYLNIGVADAPVVGTAKDMADLLRIIVSGEQLSRVSYNLLMGEDSFIPTGIDDLEYSLGLFKEVINGKEVIHHNGSELGYATYNFYIKESSTSVAILVNCNGYEACDKEHKVLYNQVLRELLK